MNIKSLLLGSAAALVAVTGARAADPIMPEADPAQYVGICSVGDFTGYLIPGTETCLKVGGEVRFRYGVVGEVRNLEGDDYIAGSRVRGRVNFDAREDTEFGVLRAFVQIQGENTFGGNFGRTRNNVAFVPTFAGQTVPVPVAGSPFFSQLTTVSDSTVIVDNAYIQLGGLTMGYLDSLWAERDGLLTDTDWSVGDFKSNRISYTYADAGFSAAVSLEDAGLGDFAPDVVGQLAYDGGAFGAYASGVYDSSADVFTTNLVNQRRDLITGVALAAPATSFLFTDPVAAFESDAAFALKGGASLKNFISEGSELKVEGHYAFDPTLYAVAGLTNGGFGGGTTLFNSLSIPSEYQIGVGYAQPIGPFGVAVSAAFGETFDLFAQRGAAVSATNPNGFINLGSSDYYLLGLNVGYEVTKNFSILGEVTYRDLDLPAAFDDYDQTAGFIQFTRKF